MSEINLPEVELNIYSKNDPVEVTVVENYVVTKESSPNIVRHITFDVSGTELVDRVKVGQSVGVLPPGKDEKGKAHRLRLYSVSSPSSGEKGEKHLISTTVKRTIEELDNKLYLGVA
jgi:ferredoxin--NADP+ reductase